LLEENSMASALGETLRPFFFRQRSGDWHSAAALTKQGQTLSRALSAVRTSAIAGSIDDTGRKAD
jgi:hypothetical protein